ncbi:MAG: MoaD/ThiS family protein [Phycisphaerales bacterium]
MTVVVSLFGPLASAVGTNQCTVRLGKDRTPEAVLGALAAEFPQAAPLLTGSRLAVNHRFATPGTPVLPSDHLAVIGLVSGG